MLKKMILTHNNGKEEFIQDSYNKSNRGERQVSTPSTTKKAGDL